MVNLVYTKQFKKKAKKYPKDKQEKIDKKLWIFFTDPYNPILKTHKLTGKLSGYWAFSIEYNLRIMFGFVDGKTVELLDIGTHSIYK